MIILFVYSFSFLVFGFNHLASQFVMFKLLFNLKEICGVELNLLDSGTNIIRGSGNLLSFLCFNMGISSCSVAFGLFVFLIRILRCGILVFAILFSS